MRAALVLLATVASARNGWAQAPTPLDVPKVARQAPPGSVSVLAALEDGTAAVSADFEDLPRLWPALDGSMEPVVLPLGARRQLAILRDADGLAIFGVDELGQLELIRTTADGQPVSRARLAAARPAVQLRATGATAVALLDDNTLALFDLHGVRTAVLVPPAGARIVDLAARASRVLAVLQMGRELRGRFVALDGAAHWTAETARLPLESLAFALSADGARLAGTSPGRATVSIVELATGAVKRTEPFDDGSGQSEARAIGFLDDGTLALRNGRRLRWSRGRAMIGGDSVDPDGDAGRMANPAVATSAFSIVPMASALMLSTPKRSKWLGYGIGSVERAFPAGAGFVVMEVQTAALVDASLRGVRTMPAPKFPGAEGYMGITVLDERHAIAAYATPPSTGAMKVVAFDFAHPGDPTALATTSQYAFHIEYEPATHLYALVDSGAVWFGRVDARTGVPQTPVHVEIPGATAVQLLVPRDDGGLVARVTTGSEPDGRRIGIEYDRVDPSNATAPVHVRNPYTHFPPTEHVRVARHGDGGLVAALANDRLTLRDASGTARWTVAASGISDVRWLRGALYEIGTGMARLDLATGARTDVRCGWDFGLWTTADHVQSGSDRMCTLEDAAQ